jgi:hypothetical protein
MTASRKALTITIGWWWWSGLSIVGNHRATERNMELIVSLVVVVMVCVVLYWLCQKLPAPLNMIGQIVVVAGGAIWLITHVREIIAAIAHI